MTPHAKIVEEATLRLSRVPSAELAAAGLEAQQAAGLDAGADFIVIACEPGTAAAIVGDVMRAATV